MLNTFLYIKSNTEEDRSKLEQAEFNLCQCCNWGGATCLSAYLPFSFGKVIHGFGYDDRDHTKIGNLDFLLFEIETQSEFILKEVKNIEDFIKFCNDCS